MTPTRRRQVFAAMWVVSLIGFVSIFLLSALAQNNPTLEVVIVVFGSIVMAAPLIFVLIEWAVETAGRVSKWTRSDVARVWSDTRRTVKTGTLVVVIAAVVIGALVALNQLPGELRRWGERNTIYRHCMNAQPSVDTIMEWWTQVSESNKIAGEVMKQRGK